MSGDWREVVFDAWREGQRIGAVGPGALDEHLRHAAGLAAHVEAPARLLDLGTGAGIPGLALAGLWPESVVTLVDGAKRRVRIVEEAIEALSWSTRVRAVHGRAEELARSGELGVFDLVTARLFGPPATTAECASPFVAPGGHCLVTEPAEASSSRWSGEGLGWLGLEVERVCSSPSAVLLRRTAPMQDRFPRKAGVAARRPLW